MQAATWHTATHYRRIYKEERGFGDGYNWGSTRFDRKTIDNKAYYAQNQLRLWEKFFTTIGVRLDDHQIFGAENTYKISSAYLIPEAGTKLKVNWGTGFKAPSVYQLYSSYGNPALNPEKSESYDFGFEQSVFNDKVSFGATCFHNDFKQMIGGACTIPGNWSTYKYLNINKAQTKGVEIDVSVRPIENVEMRVNHTFLKTEDKTTGLELTRRPSNKSNLEINYGFFGKGNINLGVTHVGCRWIDSANTRKMKPYTKVDLAAAYDVTEEFQVFGRIENLFDKKYQEVDGYATPGASFYTGVNASF